MNRDTEKLVKLANELIFIKPRVFSNPTIAEIIGEIEKDFLKATAKMFQIPYLEQKKVLKNHRVRSVKKLEKDLSARLKVNDQKIAIDILMAQLRVQDLTYNLGFTPKFACRKGNVGFNCLGGAIAFGVLLKHQGIKIELGIIQFNHGVIIAHTDSGMYICDPTWKKVAKLHGKIKRMDGYGWYLPTKKDKEKFLVVHEFESGLMNYILNNFEFMRNSLIFHKKKRNDEIPFHLNHYLPLALKYKEQVQSSNWEELRFSFFSKINSYEKDFAEEVTIERLRVEMKWDNHSLWQELRNILFLAYQKVTGITEDKATHQGTNEFFQKIWETAHPYHELIYSFLNEKGGNLVKDLPKEVLDYFKALKKILFKQHRDLHELTVLGISEKLKSTNLKLKPQSKTKKNEKSKNE